MRIIVAPDSFKGSITNLKASNAICRAIKSCDANIEVVEIPMADGGEGMVDAILMSSTGGEEIQCTVEDPLSRPIKAKYGWIVSTKTAVIETAAASGLPLLNSDEINPYKATTYGTGLLIKAALDKGANTIILGLGGSATVDGGVGLFQALGLKVLNKKGEELSHVGGELQMVDSIDLSKLDPRLKDVKIVVASDVTNPLLGETGAIHVFGPQKGITELEIQKFEDAMKQFSKAVIQATGKNKVDSPGSGAAGGIGFLLQSLLNVEFRSGLDIVSEIGNLEAYLKDADFVFTGEGKIDDQSLFGKVPVGIARLAREVNVPVIAFAGSIGEGVNNIHDAGISVVVPIIDKPMLLGEAMENGEKLLFDAVKRTMKLMILGNRVER